MFALSVALLSLNSGTFRLFVLLAQLHLSDQLSGVAEDKGAYLRHDRDVDAEETPQRSCVPEILWSIVEYEERLIYFLRKIPDSMDE